jgi:hypothetical protein
MDQQVLQIGRVGIFTAHSLGGGTAVAGIGAISLFALVAKHRGVLLEMNGITLDGVMSRDMGCVRTTNGDLTTAMPLHSVCQIVSSGKIQAVSVVCFRKGMRSNIFVVSLTTIRVL